MKFGQEYEAALASEGFPAEWVQKAIEYKHLKKCIKKIHAELKSLGFDAKTVESMAALVSGPETAQSTSGKEREYFAGTKPTLSSIPEEFSPRLRILVDAQTGMPLDAKLAPETRESLEKLARHELVVAGRREHLGQHPHLHAVAELPGSGDEHDSARRPSTTSEAPDAKWVTVPLSSAQDFFEMLEPKLVELDELRDNETQNLEDEIFELGEEVENVVQPVREGCEATRSMSYRDLYFWREMFRLYLEKPIFYSETERRRGALTFQEAKANLEDYDKRLRETGLLLKMKTKQAKAAAKHFLDINVHILNIMHFQEMNARATYKILKKFNKQTHLGAQQFMKGLMLKYPALMSSSKNGAGGFADSIARDLHAEIGSKVLSVVPQLDDWICPVCYGMAWRPVNLGCCKSVFCIRCIIRLQDEGKLKCPMCNAETVKAADGRNIDFETMDFLEKYFPLEVKKRQKENERAQLVRDYGEEFVKPACTAM